MEREPSSQILTASTSVYPVTGLPDQPQRLRKAIEYCRILTARHSSTFYLGSRFFPPLERAAVWAVYATCRTGDDAVDELSGPSARAALEAWYTRNDNAFKGLFNDPVGEAFAWAIKHFSLQKAPFEELYQGLSMDLEPRRYATLDELLLYCRRVAGVVGWMIAPICGYSGGDDTLTCALKLGMAMQLTNILRDVGEDLRRNRLYLPQSLLEKHGISESALQRALEPGYLPAGYSALMHDLSTHARELYREGWIGIPRVRGRARVALGIAAQAYEGILDVLERNGWDNFTRRAHLSDWRKLTLVPGAWWRSTRTSRVSSP